MMKKIDMVKLFMIEINHLAEDVKSGWVENNAGAVNLFELADANEPYDHDSYVMGKVDILVSLGNALGVNAKDVLESIEL